MNHIVKRKGHYEAFDEKKVYASVYAACLSTQLKKQEAENLAKKVTKEVKKWIEERSAVSSTRIFLFVTRTLHGYNKEVAFMYHTHRDIN